MTVDIQLMQDFQKKPQMSVAFFKNSDSFQFFSLNRKGVFRSHFLQHTSLLYENRWWRCGACNWGYPYENEDALRKNCQFFLLCMRTEMCEKEVGLFSNQRGIIKQRTARGIFSTLCMIKVQSLFAHSNKNVWFTTICSLQAIHYLIFWDNLTQNYARFAHHLFFPK